MNSTESKSFKKKISLTSPPNIYKYINEIITQINYIKLISQEYQLVCVYKGDLDCRNNYNKINKN